MKYPKEPEVGVGALLIDPKERVLLVRRKYPPAKGKWSVPGGHVKLGEPLYAAAIRELKEETGVEAEPVGVVNIDEMVERDSKGRIRYHYVLIDVLVKPLSDPEKARASSDALETALVPLDRVLELDLTRTVRSLFEKILRRKTLTVLETNFIQYTE